MGCLWLVGSIILQVSFAKEPYKRDNILQKRLITLSILLTVAPPWSKESAVRVICMCMCVCVCVCVCMYVVHTKKSHVTFTDRCVCVCVCRFSCQGDLYVCMCVCVCVCMYVVHTKKSYVTFTDLCVCVCVCMYVCDISSRQSPLSGLGGGGRV